MPAVKATQSRPLRHQIRRSTRPNLLFSLPTICDEIPLTGSTLAPAGQSTFRLHEDDWRQAELVAVTHRQVIEKNLADIRRVLNSRVGIGFPTIVVRSEPRYPLLSVVLTRSDLAEAFGRHTASFRAVGYEAEGNAIDGGFAFAVDGAVIYGLDDGDRLRVAAIHLNPQGWTPTLRASVEQLLAAHDVVLVDWCRAAVSDTP